MARLFGTDGVRGLANAELSAPLALNLAAAAARVLGPSNPDGRVRAVVGRDPRASGEFLEAAVSAGLASAGVDVIRVGVVPTPALAFLTGELDVDFGVMLSASHNAMPDNGIKIFARGGHKLPDEAEDQIEAALDEDWQRPVGAEVGRIEDFELAGDLYVQHLLAALPNKLDGIKLIVDCANGAASVVGPEAYRAAGADVISIHAFPDGLNINDNCGSTHMDDLRAQVIEHGADLGLAHDGDADRCLAVDADGNMVDGDQLIAILSMAMRDAGTLRSDTVVGTVMANLGFKIAMTKAGITMVETAVGDRYVLEAMRDGDFALGGEQSGHVVFADIATTGDGVLTGLMVCAEMARTGKPLAELASIVEKLPQVLINVPNVDKTAVETNEELQAAVTAASERLGDTGRVLLRPSGTEPLVRVMVEAATHDEAQAVADELAEVVSRTLAITQP